VEAIFTVVAATLQGLGFPGLVIAALSYWVWHREGILNTIQEARIKEGREVLTAITANAEATNRLVEALKQKTV